MDLTALQECSLSSVLAHLISLYDRNKIMMEMVVVMG